MFQLPAFVFAVFALLSATFSPTPLPFSVKPLVVTAQEPPVPASCPGCGLSAPKILTTGATPIGGASLEMHSSNEHGECHIAGPNGECIQKKTCRVKTEITMTTDDPIPGFPAPFPYAGTPADPEGMLRWQHDDGTWSMYLVVDDVLPCGTLNKEYQLKMEQERDGEWEMRWTVDILANCWWCQV